MSYRRQGEWEGDGAASRLARPDIGKVVVRMSYRRQGEWEGDGAASRLARPDMY